LWNCRHDCGYADRCRRLRRIGRLQHRCRRSSHGARAGSHPRVARTLDRARAVAIDVPRLEAPPKISAGAARYSTLCVSCHLATGMMKSDLREGLYPHPPNLAQEDTRDARRAFWTIKHGIKMSAMPAWGSTLKDDSIWDIAKMPGWSLPIDSFRISIATVAIAEMDDRTELCCTLSQAVALSRRCSLRDARESRGGRIDWRPSRAISDACVIGQHARSQHDRVDRIVLDPGRGLHRSRVRCGRRARSASTAADSKTLWTPFKHSIGHVLS